MGFSGVISTTSPKSSAYDSSARGFFIAQSDAGVTLTDTQKNATNQLVIDLKAAGLWNKMKAVYPIVGGTATSHKFNLITPADTNAAFRLNFVGGWTHSANGALPNGTNAYADTFLVPNNNLNNYNSHLSYYSRTNNTHPSIDIGSYGDGTNFFMQLYSSILLGSRSSIQRSDTDYAFFSSTNRQGLFIGNSTASNLQKIYQNSTLRNTNTVNNIMNRSTYKLYIGALNNTNTPASYTNRQCAFASIGDGLTDAEALSLYNAVNAFQVSLARNV